MQISERDASRVDAACLAAMAQGSESALRVLHDRLATKTFRFVLRLVRNEAIAEEIVNEVFAEIWRKAGAFRGGSSVSTWLLAVARNKAMDRLRKRAEEPLDEVVAARVPDRADDPEAALVKSDAAAHLRTAITRLTTAHREVIDLVYYQERSVCEAAAILDVPEATVKTRMFYARKQLARMLEGSGIAA